MNNAEEDKKWYQSASNIRSLLTIASSCVVVGIAWGNLSAKIDALDKSVNAFQSGMSSFQSQMNDFTKDQGELKLSEKLLEQRVLTLEQGTPNNHHR